MIIDVHEHLIGPGWVPRSFLISIGRLSGQQDGKEAAWWPLIYDTTGETLVARMDAAGVDRSCIFSTDWGLLTGEAEVSIFEQNQAVAAATKRFPNRLIAFFAIDPRRPKAVTMLQRAVEDWGMRGVKLLPVAGFYPYDPVAYPLYEKCTAYGIPLLCHCGLEASPAKSRFAHPINYDDVAADFPDLPIILAHAGMAMWWREALAIAKVKPNIYFDVAAWQAEAWHQPHLFYEMLRTVLDGVGPWRVFFGSDGPPTELAWPLKEWVRKLKEPDLSSCPGISFTPEEMEIVLGKAAARLLKLE
jgi:predicted TIM-barrel fold metal-dependent hydrolase